MEKIKLSEIYFSSYKKFDGENHVKIKPITILVGKNSSGKSSISKLFSLYEASLSGKQSVPFKFDNEGVSIGTSFADVAHDGNNIGLSFGVKYEDGLDIRLDFISINGKKDFWIKTYLVTCNGHNHLLEQQKDKAIYVDKETSKEYSINGFRGFIHEKFLKDCGVANWDKYVINTDYIGPFRICPQRTYSLQSSSCYKKIGVDGIQAYNNLICSERLCVAVSDWYYSSFGSSLEVDNLDAGIFSIKLSRETSGHKVNISDEGQGMGQILPIAVRCNMEDEDDTIIVVEQPELHLHPAAHNYVAAMFAKTSLSNKHRYIIETHSKNILLGIRSAVVDKSIPIKKEDVVIYFVDDSEGAASLREITVNDKGELSDWPEGVFNEAYEQIKLLHKLSEE